MYSYFVYTCLYENRRGPLRFTWLLPLDKALSEDVTVRWLRMSLQKLTPALLCGRTEKNGESEFQWQMLGCLILSHMGLNTFRAPQDATNKQHLLYKHKHIHQQLDGQRLYFTFFFSLGYFKMGPYCAVPVPPEADCAPLSASCWLSGRNDPAAVCEQCSFQSFPSCCLLSLSVVKLPRPAGGAG